jgi:DNA polymerase I-like protein with 3'-5' exonuclease and polymerase domains
VQLRCVQSISDLDELKRWAGERRETPLGVDTETSGLDIGRHKVRLLQLGDLRTGWAIPFELWGGGALEILRKYDSELVGHNIPFDQRFIKHSGGLELPWHKLHDTLILGALDDPGRPRGLKPLSNLLIDPRASAGQQSLDDGMRENGWDWGTVPVDYTPYWCYGALDAVLTCHLWQKLHPRVMASCPAVYDLEMGTARVVSRMMEAGLKIDRPHVTEKIRELKHQSEEIRAWLVLAYGISTPNSGPQIAKAFTTLGYEVEAVTSTGQPRIDKEVLQAIGKATEDPVVRDLARSVYAVRHAERVISNYLENFRDLASSDDIIRCQIWTLTAKTGRMSVTEPALQTLHRDDKTVRGCFIPRPGHVFISCDFSQVEMRLAAALSGDEGLIEAFKESDNGGLDFYSGIASELFGEFVPKDDKRRQATKTMSYAKLYGAGVATMARSIGLPQTQVKTIHDAFNSRFPGLERLARDTAASAWEQKHSGDQPAVILPSGRRLPVDREHASVNYLIQGAAAEVLKRAGLNVEAAGFGGAMRLFIHDELLSEVPAEDAEECRVAIEEAMTDNSFAVPLTCAAKILPERWVKT